MTTPDKIFSIHGLEKQTEMCYNPKKGIQMQLSYEPLNNLLALKNMTKTELRTAAGLSKDTLARIGKNESVTLSTIVSICEVLECKISDVVEIIPSTGAEVEG